MNGSPLVQVSSIFPKLSQSLLFLAFVPYLAFLNSSYVLYRDPLFNLFVRARRHKTSYFIDVMILFTLLNNCAFYHKSLFPVCEATPFLRSVTDQNVVFSLKFSALWSRLCRLTIRSLSFALQSLANSRIFVPFFLYEASSRLLGG